MNYYSIYGSCLASDVEFPELRAIEPADAKWTFATTPQLEPMRDSVALGAELIYGECHARLFRHAGGHRITVDDTGDFDLSADGRHAVWQEREESWPDFVRAHLMGRVLGTSLFHEGLLPLHGSAVEFETGVAAFIAPKGYGKSSIALTLTQLGAKLVTDDTLPVSLTNPITTVPGVHSMRLKPDSLLSTGATDSGPLTREGKRVVSDLPLERLSQGPAPLRAIYLLNPVVAEDAAVPTSRSRLPEISSAFAIVAHTKIAQMLGSSAAPVLLERAVTIARSVPVYRLFVSRDLNLLPGIAETIAEWHR